MKLIDKDALVAEIERKIEERDNSRDEAIWNNELWSETEYSYRSKEDEAIIDLINTLEVKEVDLEKESAMSNFKSLLHLNGDMKSTCKDWGYAPNLYYFDGTWHVTWISSSEGDALIDFEGSEIEIAIQKACDWFHSKFCNN